MGFFPGWTVAEAAESARQVHNQSTPRAAATTAQKEPQMDDATRKALEAQAKAAQAAADRGSEAARKELEAANRAANEAMRKGK